MSVNPTVNALAGFMNTSAQASGGDYKAVVHLFWNGGNDQSNTLFKVAPDAEYQKYAAPRLDVAYTKDEGILLTPSNYSAATLHLNPSLSRLAARFNAGKAAILANVGMLSVPTTRADFVKPYGVVPTVQLPFQLFSHNDQQNHWGSMRPNDTTETGWLGRMCDLLRPAFNSGPVSPAITAGGNWLGMNGFDTPQYQVGRDGPVPLYGLDAISNENGGLSLTQISENAFRAPSTNHLENVVVRIASRAMDCAGVVRNGLDAAGEYAQPFPGSNLGGQLKIVSRLIKARAALGHRRDVFFVQQGGFDFHSNLRTDQEARLADFDECQDAFYLAMVEAGLQDKVCIATGSDFGRSLQANGGGSDHGWGSHHFVIGGNCKGGQILGTMPDVGLGTADDGGEGRLIPTTSADQYVGALARFLGIPQVGVEGVVAPYIGRFPAGFEIFN